MLQISLFANLDNHPEIPKKIIEGLTASLISHVSMCQQQNLFKDYKNVGTFNGWVFVTIIFYCSYY